MTIFTNKYCVQLLLKLKQNKMKNLILLAILGTFLICGCDNPTSVNEKSSDNVNRNCINEPDTVYIGMFQNYGYCDTVCVGQSVILVTDKALSGVCTIYNYTTGGDSLWNGNLWLQNSGIFLTYHTTGKTPFGAETGLYNLILQGEGIIQLNLNNNTNYNLIIQ
jgi:hypothetical protein